jgi:hypothetical protein
VDAPGSEHLNVRVLRDPKIVSPRVRSSSTA